MFEFIAERLKVDHHLIGNWGIEFVALYLKLEANYLFSYLLLVAHFPFRV